MLPPTACTPTPPPKTILNADCWLLILDLLFGHFRTLARVMQTSKSMMIATAPLLYGQIGHPLNVTTIKHWSIRKRGRLVTLLLSSSGFINPAMDTEQFQSLYRQLLSCPTLQFYSTPLTIDYFALVKQLPIDLIEELVWDLLMDDENGMKPIVPDVDRRHAGVLAEIVVSHQAQIDRWLPWAEEFSQLAKLTLYNMEPFPAQIKEKLAIFLTRNIAAYPSKRIEIECAHQYQTEVMMVLNKIVAPKKIRIFGVHRFDPVSAKDECGYLRNLTEFELHELNTQYRGILDVDLLEATVNLDRLLYHSRQLQSIKIRKYASSRTNFDSLLSWAPTELSENSTNILEPPPPPPSSLLPQPSPSSRLISSSPGVLRSLVPIKELVAIDTPVSILSNAIDGFRNTLEKVSFRGLSRNVVMGAGWSWPLTRLTSLKLTGGIVSMSKLELCPVLEDLFLEDVTPRADAEDGLFEGLWQAPLLLRRLTLIRGGTFKALNTDSIRRLERLEYLVLNHQNQDLLLGVLLKSMPAWNLSRLKYLRLHKDANTIWQAFLLRSAPNLEIFASPDHTMAYPLYKTFGDGQNHFTRHEVKESETKHAEESGIQTSNQDLALRAQRIHLERLARDRLFGHMILQQINIRSLWYGGGDWTREQVVDLTAMLGRLEEPLGYTQDGQQGFLLLPHLAYVRLEVPRSNDDDENETSACKYSGGPDFDQLLMVLMTRPKMKRVLTVNWSPSVELILARLKKVEEFELPNSIVRIDSDVNEFLEVDDDVEFEDVEDYGSDGLTGGTQDSSRFCVLVVEQAGYSSYFRLRQ